jgi:hypothetical protein
MKMRVLIGVLLVLNLIQLAWQFDAFGRWGWGPNVGREPARLQQQVQPEALKFSVPAASEASAASAPETTASAATETAKEASAAEAAAARAARKRARAAAAAAAAESE